MLSLNTYKDQTPNQNKIHKFRTFRESKFVGKMLVIYYARENEKQIIVIKGQDLLWSSRTSNKSFLKKITVDTLSQGTISLI